MKPAIVFIIFCNLFLSSHTISSSPHLLKEIWGLSAEKPLLHPDLEIVRDRIIKDLLAGPLDDAEVKRITQSLQNGGSWPGIDYEDVSRTGFEHSGHLSNMLVLARAYKNPESTFYQNDQVKKVLSSALDFWLENDFICENWWWNEMGTPRIYD